jgi:outer membrane receptor protein involved in Fe transport
MRYLKVSVASLATLLASSAFAQDKEKGLDEVVVKGVINKKSETAILQDQKKSVVLKQTVGSEEISRKGIANVEEGLTKVSGVTTVEGQGIVIRGLDARYNFLLVNQLATPSNNPFEKIISLKQLPTNIVGGIDIYKTYNPDLYADFAGATINLETKQPNTPFTTVGFSLGYTTNNNFRDFLISPDANSPKGFVGLNSENRKLSSYFGQIPSGKSVDPRISGKVFKSGWDSDKITSPLNSGMSFSHGNKHKFGAEKDYFSYLFSLNHSSSYNYKEGTGNTWTRAGEREVINNYQFIKMAENNYKTLTSSLLATSLQLGKLKLDWNTFFIQDNQNIIKDQVTAQNLLIRANQQEISRLVNTQLLANYKFNDRNSLKLGGSYVYTAFGQPDRKAMRINLDPDQVGGTISYGGSNLQRQFFDFKTKGYFSGLAEYALKLGEKNDKNEYQYQLNFGYNGFYDSRESSYRFMRDYAKRNLTSVVADINKIDQVITRDMLAGEHSYEESSEPVYQAKLKSMVNAGYASLNYKPNSSWDILLGLRAEQAMQEIAYRPKDAAFNDKFQQIKTNKLFILPSLNIKKALDQNSNLRLALSKSITRSVMMERYPIDYINPDGTSVQGNPNLLNSQNYNVDLKYELFPSKKELLAVTLYGKKLIDPIERSSAASASGDGFIFTFMNAKEAVIAGAELDAIVDLDKQIGLKNFSLGFNASYMYTNVKSNNALSKKDSGFETFDERPLQGASPWLLNADLKYDFTVADTKNTASLVYNVYAKRIYSIGVNRMDHLYEMPFHSLDLVLMSKLSKHWETNFSISNILNPAYKIEMGQNGQVDLAPGVGYTFREYKRGVGFGLSVNYKF